MFSRQQIAVLVLTCLTCLGGHVRVVCAQGLAGPLIHERPCLEIRQPEQLARVHLPDLPNPRTVARSELDEDAPPRNMSLDEAIRIALANSEVVRLLAGQGVVSSGQTIYDPALANTEVDAARSTFSPSVNLGNEFERQEIPRGVFDPAFAPPLPSRAQIDGEGIDQYRMGLEAAKKTVTGGTARLLVQANPSRSNGLGLAGEPPLNPQTGSTLDLEYRQPLLQGAGRRVNVAPILIARMETERSFYQLKASVQQLVRGVIEGYWALVFARTDVWARQQQVEQAQWAFDLAEARLRQGLGNAGDVAQARSTLANFRARLVTARADLLQREAVLRNILGIPPSGGTEIVPVSPPHMTWIETDWPAILDMAGTYRTDLIDRKLVLEQDEQHLILARNRALPQVDAKALYRWNHLEGRGPDDAWVVTDPGQFTGWQLGVDVALPVGLVQARAELRRRELTLMRDRANLQQALHEATHELANSYRNLGQFFQEYKAFKDTREAARINLDAQTARWSAGLTIYLNVLQAIASWGEAIDSEAQSLLRYNTELAYLEQRSGTILESHGIRFTEDSFSSIGPAGRLFPDHCYPMDRRPDSNVDRYPVGTEPAENAFELDNLDVPDRRLPNLPLPRPRPPTDDNGPSNTEPLSPADALRLFQPSRGP